jgi:protocatechuate 3,4-dioxygenase beta subunit
MARMDAPSPRTLSRRDVFRLGVPAALAMAAGGLVLLPPTLPRADAADDPTPGAVEGPYFKARSPERSVLREATTAGTPFLLTGRVVSTKGEPIAKALLDVWQTDGNGAYDLVGYAMRGHQLTADDGSYRLDTVVPGYYPGRTRHIHVKVQRPSGPVLTTQLFFPNDPRNRGDGIYSTWLRMRVWDVDGGKAGSFSFVLA